MLIIPSFSKVGLKPLATKTTLALGEEFAPSSESCVVTVLRKLFFDMQIHILPQIHSIGYLKTDCPCTAFSHAEEQNVKCSEMWAVISIERLKSSCL